MVRFEVLTRRISVGPSLTAVSIGQQSSIIREDERSVSIIRVKQMKRLHQLLGLEVGTATILRNVGRYLHGVTSQKISMFHALNC
jgi:hypothetical protein